MKVPGICNKRSCTSEGTYPYRVSGATAPLLVRRGHGAADLQHAMRHPPDALAAPNTPQYE
jgi:hypothetical protein